MSRALKEVLKATKKALKNKDSSKKEFHLTEAAQKANRVDPKARAGKMKEYRKLKEEKASKPRAEKKSGTREERAEKARDLRELREQRPDNIKELKFKAGGALKAVKKLLSKKRKAGKSKRLTEENNPYKSTVGDSYATRAKKQHTIEQMILRDTHGRSPKKQKEMLKTLSERMKKERKETFDRRGMKAGGALKAPTNPGLKKLPTKVRNKMGYMKAGGKVTSKCKRDGIAIRGRTKGRMV